MMELASVVLFHYFEFLLHLLILIMFYIRPTFFLAKTKIAAPAKS